jgi:hypothetical protein
MSDYDRSASKKCLAAGSRHRDPVTGVLTSGRIVLSSSGLRDVSGRLSISAVEGAGVRSGWQNEPYLNVLEPFLRVWKSIPASQPNSIPFPMLRSRSAAHWRKVCRRQSLSVYWCTLRLLQRGSKIAGDRACSDERWLAGGFGDRRWGCCAGKIRF